MGHIPRPPEHAATVPVSCSLRLLGLRLDLAGALDTARHQEVLPQPIAVEEFGDQGLELRLVLAQTVGVAPVRAAVIATTPVPHPISSTVSPEETRAKFTSAAAGMVVIASSGAKKAQPSRWAALNWANGSLDVDTSMESLVEPNYPSGNFGTSGTIAPSAGTKRSYLSERSARTRPFPPPTRAIRAL